MQINIVPRPFRLDAIVAAGILSCAGANLALGQDNASTPVSAAAPTVPKAVEISDEPRMVDPSTLVSPQLAQRVSVKFQNQPLKAVWNWLQRERSLNLFLDSKALSAAKIQETDPVNEELIDEPLYLLLARLEGMGLAWYEADQAIHVTSQADHNKSLTTLTYPIGDLIDGGYSAQAVIHTLSECQGHGMDKTNHMTIDLLGDVLFIRQTAQRHREISGLLSALRRHGRRTLTFDSPQNALIRTSFDQRITVDFYETPLAVAVQELSRQAKINIRLDRTAAAKGSVREKMPVTIKLNDQPLGLVINMLLASIELTSDPRDGVLWITSAEAANQFHKTAVYDVRDLCVNQNESNALQATLLKQIRAKWSLKGELILETPKPGVLVVQQVERVLDDVLQLLEKYRVALRSSKRRADPESEYKDPREVVTGYYRLPRSLADEMHNHLPNTISVETWKSAERPDAIGSITCLSLEQTFVQSSSAGDRGNLFATENAVLIIRQTRAAHAAIGQFIRAVMESRSVDPIASEKLNDLNSTPEGTFGSSLMPTAAN